MPVTVLSNHFKREVMAGNLSFESGEFKMVLMQNDFVFDPDTDSTFTDISGEILENPDPTFVVLTSGELIEDDSNDRGRMTWADVTFNFISGSGPVHSAILFSGEILVAGIDFGEEFSIVGGDLKIQAVAVNLW